MDALTAAAASGLRSRLEALDLIANNLANASTGGYKADRERYGLYQAAGSETGDLPVIERQWTDFSPGEMRVTGNPADLALGGRGFFAVDGPSGPLYTRNGAFRVSPAGRLTTTDGYALRMAGGGAVQLDPARPFEVTPEGAVRQDGAELGRLEIADFADLAVLAKHARTYFRNTGPAPGPPAAGVEVHQGKLEASNSGGAEGAVQLIGALRQFEMLQKALSLGAEMNRKAFEEVARVGS